jgi:hypothetical protein
LVVKRPSPDPTDTPTPSDSPTPTAEPTDSGRPDAESDSPRAAPRDDNSESQREDR